LPVVIINGTTLLEQVYSPVCSPRFGDFSMRVRRLFALVAAVAVVALTRPVGAQSGRQGMLIPIANRSYIAFNPLGIPFDIFTAEAETAVAQGVTVGGLASHLDVDDDRYTSLDLKFRYYPGDVVLRGFSLGASLGYLGYSNEISTAPVTLDGMPAVVRKSINTPTIGILADYNWMLGVERRFLVGTGIGAKRVLASGDERGTVGLDRAYLTGRFVVGIAF
jgi:hypothetical protein